MQEEISPYEFAQWLRNHDIYASRVAELMGIKSTSLFALFNRRKNWRGKPIHFTPALIDSLNKAIQALAGQLIRAHICFDYTKTVTKRGRVYNPGCIEDLMNGVGSFIVIKTFVKSSLGWSGAKYKNALTNHCSKIYGNITREDVQIMNDRLDHLALELADMRVVLPDYSDEYSEKPTPTPVETTAFFTDAEQDIFFKELNNDVRLVEDYKLSPENFMEKWQHNPKLKKVKEDSQLYVRIAFDSVRDVLRTLTLHEESLLNEAKNT